ncbi:hypothetical protein GIX45_00105 [Erwinia sp. CPCC 100877]|nr:hypothetical protein [Erwinia sp. CPCC 100877]
MAELPLIIFTLLVQGAVGLTVAILLFQLATRNTLPAGEIRHIILPPLMITAIATACGLAASTLHLGYPLNALNALRHVTSSWLSREIVFASLYLAAVGLAAILALFFRKFSIPLQLTAGVLGAIDIFCMGAIYVHSSVATWTHFNTWVVFFGAALSIGATAGLWAFGVKAHVDDNLRRKIITCAVAVLIATTLIRLLEQMSYFSYLSGAGLSEAITFPHQPLAEFEQLRGWYIAAWVILIAGVAIQALSARFKVHKPQLAVGCCAVIVAEILLRFVFFSLN